MIRSSPARYSSHPPPPARTLSRRALIALVALGLPALAMAAVSAKPRTRARLAPAERGLYVAIPHPASVEMRRKGAYIARSRRLPLIAEPGVKDVVVKEFRK